MTLLRQLLAAFAEQALEQILAGDVAGAVARLSQVQVLLEFQQLRLVAHPAARRPFDVHRSRFRHGHFIRMRIQRTEAAGSALRQHDPDDLAHPWIVVVQPGVHEHLFHTGSRALVAAVENVVQQGTAANRACVRLVTDLRQVEPVIEMRVQRGRIVVHADEEEISFGLGHKLTQVLAQCRFHVVFYGHDFVVAQKCHEFRCRLVGPLVVLFRARDRLERRQLAIAVLLQPE